MSEATAGPPALPTPSRAPSETRDAATVAGIVGAAAGVVGAAQRSKRG